MILIAKCKNLEVFAHFDDSAKVYELFASDTGGDYIGCADTLPECRKLAREWFTERLEG
jgi:hypothetical protein